MILAMAAAVAVVMVILLVPAQHKCQKVNENENTFNIQKPCGYNDYVWFVDESEFLYIYHPHQIFIFMRALSVSATSLLFSLSLSSCNSVSRSPFHSFIHAASRARAHLTRSNFNLFYVSCCGLCDGDEVFASSLSFQLCLFSVSSFSASSCCSSSSFYFSSSSALESPPSV